MRLPIPQKLLFALLPLMVGGSLSAVEIPVELPSGATLHLHMQSIFPDELMNAIWIDTTLNTQEELQLFTKELPTLKTISQALQKTWRCDDVILSVITALVYNPYPSWSFSPVNNMEIQEIPFTQAITFKEPFQNFFTTISTATQETPIETQQETSTASSSEQHLELPQKEQEESRENLPEVSFILFISSNDFGGNWRLTPHELRFVQKINPKNPGNANSLEMLVVLVNVGDWECYHKTYAYPDFFPAKRTSRILTSYPDNTFSAKSPSETLLFNPAGQLIHSLNNDQLSSTYNYCDGKLVNICHPNHLNLSFEYTDGKVTGINGLSNKISLQYEDQNLCYVSDSQNSYLHLFYDRDDLDLIVDDSHNYLFDGDSDYKEPIYQGERIPLLFHPFGEIFYYKTAQDTWKLSFREINFED